MQFQSSLNLWTNSMYQMPRHLQFTWQMIPMKEVRLIWNSEVPLPEGIWLSRDWIPFSRNPHQLKFSFMCEQEDVCNKLKIEMKEVSEQKLGNLIQIAQLLLSSVLMIWMYQPMDIIIILVCHFLYNVWIYHGFSWLDRVFIWSFIS